VEKKGKLVEKKGKLVEIQTQLGKKTL